jgi:hypothetical protein
MGKETPAKSASLTLDGAHATHLVKFFVVSDQNCPL